VLQRPGSGLSGFGYHRALKQISEKQYVTDMKSRSVQTMIQYGVAFSGKNVEISTSEV